MRMACKSRMATLEDFFDNDPLGKKIGQHIFEFKEIVMEGESVSTRMPFCDLPYLLYNFPMQPNNVFAKPWPNTWRNWRTESKSIAVYRIFKYINCQFLALWCLSYLLDRGCVSIILTRNPDRLGQRLLIYMRQNSNYSFWRVFKVKPESFVINLNVFEKHHGERVNTERVEWMPCSGLVNKYYRLDCL